MYELRGRERVGEMGCDIGKITDTQTERGRERQKSTERQIFREGRLYTKRE